MLVKSPQSFRSSQVLASEMAHAMSKIKWPNKVSHQLRQQKAVFNFSSKSIVPSNCNHQQTKLTDNNPIHEVTPKSPKTSNSFQVKQLHMSFPTSHKLKARILKIPLAPNY